MSTQLTYMRRTSDGVLSTSNIAELFPDWKGDEECWLFVSPHDDDIVIGAGLTLLTGLAEGAQVHAAVATDGSMGYCKLSQRDTVAKVRLAEAKRSFQTLGMPENHLWFLGFPDCDLHRHRGRRFSTAGLPSDIAGASGLQNAFTYVLRQVRPTRVFIPTITDLHPDHQIVNEELLISLFHSQGTIWPELGDPIPAIPKVYEFATYCDYITPPQIRIETTPAMFETKLQGILAYASQEQIGETLEGQRKAGPVEYLRDMEFHFYSPSSYDALFLRKS
jgi:LmbE family N-acetylglucosaminyl deacetylase